MATAFSAIGSYRDEENRAMRFGPGAKKRGYTAETC